MINICSGRRLPSVLVSLCLVAGAAASILWSRQPADSKVSSIPGQLVEQKAKVAEEAKAVSKSLEGHYREAELHGRLLNTLKAMHGKYDGTIFLDDAMTPIFEQIEGGSGLKDIMTKSLVDHEFVKDKFGEEQAFIRVQALRFVKHRLHAGYDEECLLVINDLLKSLDGVNPVNGKFEHAQDRDLEDLIRMYEAKLSQSIAGSGDDELESYLRNLSQAIGLTKKSSAAIKEIFENTLFLAFRARYGRERAQVLIGKIMNGLGEKE